MGCYTCRGEDPRCRCNIDLPTTELPYGRPPLVPAALPRACCTPLMPFLTPPATTPLTASSYTTSYHSYQQVRLFVPWTHVVSPHLLNTRSGPSDSANEAPGRPSQALIAPMPYNFHPCRQIRRSTVVCRRRLSPALHVCRMHALAWASKGGAPANRRPANPNRIIPTNNRMRMCQQTKQLRVRCGFPEGEQDLNT